MAGIHVGVQYSQVRGERDKPKSGYTVEIVNQLNKNNDEKSDSSAEEKIRHISVGIDGNGCFSSVQSAIDSVPDGNMNPVVISIKPGTYKERIVVPPGKRFIRFKGQDAKTTVLTYNLYAGIKDQAGKEIGTFRTPSVTIEGDDFAAEGITFENSAGPVGQAVAIAVLGDRCVFRNCRFLGWQDTLLDQTGRHYYLNCYITGHCDFIFGGGSAFFERCRIHCLKNGYITAASTPESQSYGYVFSNCTITGESADVKTYLGRPWRDYANVIFLNTDMSEAVRPEGWNNWGKPDREKTSRYAEYNSAGTGANPQARVPWARQLNTEQADKITLHNVLAGRDDWNPNTGAVQQSLKVLPASEADAESIKKKLTDEIGKDLTCLIALFRDDGQGGLSFVTSSNGLDWVIAGESVLKSEAGAEKLFLHPFVLQGRDGIFHLVWQTDNSGGQGFGYAYSEDLIHWSEQKYVALMDSHKAYNAVSPSLFYNQANKEYIVFWASTLPGNYFQAYQEEVEDNPRLWFTTTGDFKTFAPARLYFEPGYSVQDGALVNYGSQYALIHDDHRRMFRTLRTAFGDTPVGPWNRYTDALGLESCREPAALKVGKEIIVYFHFQRKDCIGALITDDFVIWRDITNFVIFPAGYHIGSILKVDRKIAEKLQRH